MSGAINFGEYEVLLPRDQLSSALTFSRELFSRDYVVQRVDAEMLKTIATEDKSHWRGLAALKTGHVVVFVDRIPVRGLSWSDFNALVAQQNDPETAVATDEKLSDYRRLRFCDRRRADIEVEMQKDWASSGPTLFEPLQSPDEMQTKLREAHGLIWNHQLTQAHATLRALPVGSDPMVCLLAVELEVVRVLVSKDALYRKQAKRAGKQAVTWLQSLYELSSLSYSSRKQMKLALAEALLLLALLRLGANQRLAAVTTARRSAALYVELGEKLMKNAAKRDRLLMPESDLHDFLLRIKFGVGALHVGGSLALQSTLEWVGILMKGTCNPIKGLQHVLNCCHVASDGIYHFRANWAALALMHSSAAIRRIRQREPSEGELIDHLAQKIVACQHAAVQRHPMAILFLWNQTTVSINDDDQLKQLEAHLARVWASGERVHVVRFEVGYRRFLMRDFDCASMHLMVLCNCASAPPKLRGLSSLFLAVGYLLSSAGAGVQDSKLLNSVRLLLRSARRFLALRLESHEDDAESASLHKRLEAYVDGSDEYLHLLPWEILYVFCYSTRVTTRFSPSIVSQSQHHLVALQHLDRLSERGVTDKKKHTAELCLLRAIVLFNLHDLDACHDELQRLWELLESDGRSRSSFAFGRLLSPRLSSPPPAFVAPVAWFYQLRLLLERKCSREEVDSISSPKSGVKATSDAGSRYTDAVQESPYPYHYIYSGKLQALSKLATRLAVDKIDGSSSQSTRYRATKSI